MSFLDGARSTADKATYAFACPTIKDGEGMGVHVSMLNQKPGDDKLNFWMDVDAAQRLAKALNESLEYIYQKKIEDRS